MTIEQQKESAREDLRLAVDMDKRGSGWWIMPYWWPATRDFSESELRWLAAFREQAK